MRSERVVVRGVEIEALVRPGGPIVLFLHGLAGHRGEWSPVIEHLETTVGVIAPDQRAHGESWDGSTTPECDRAGYVGDAVALIESLANGPVIVVGQSMGGIVATLLAHRRPDLVDRLVLVETGLAPMAESDFAALKEWFDSWPDRFVDDNHASDFFGPDARSTAAWVDGLAKTACGLVRRFDPDAMLKTMRALASTSRLAEWRDITAPTTLIRASETVISDGDIADMIAIRPEVEFVEISDSGHDVHLDQPACVAEVLSRLIDADD